MRDEGIGNREEGFRCSTSTLTSTLMGKEIWEKREEFGLAV